MIPVVLTRSGAVPDLGKVAFAPCSYTSCLPADGPLDGEAPGVDQSARPDFSRCSTQGQRIASQVQLADHSRASHRSHLARPVQHGTADPQDVFRHLARGVAESFIHQSVGAKAGIGFRRQLDVCGSERENPRWGSPLDGTRSSPCHIARRFRSAGLKSRPDGPLQPSGNPRGSRRPGQLRAFDKAPPAVCMRYSSLLSVYGSSPRFPSGHVPIMFSYLICSRGAR